MTNNHLSSIIFNSNKLISDCNQYPENEAASQLAQNLTQALKTIEESKKFKPLVITLLGGTGTGKSYIFSKLVGKEGISPSSDSIRGFTKELFVSAFLKDRAFLPFQQEVNFTDGMLANTVLIDTPDLDSVEQSNLELTKKTIEISDILIYVTTPDKRSDFDLSKNILNWASSKRWLFAMNKIDTVAENELEAVKKDFKAKISELGFTPTNDQIFFFNAKDDKPYELMLLKDLLFSERTREQTKYLKQEIQLRTILQELKAANILEALLKLNQKIKNETLKVKESNEELVKDFLALEATQSLVKNHTETLIWKELLTRHSFFIFPYIYLKNKLSAFSSINLKAELRKIFENQKKYSQLKYDEDRFLKDNGLLITKNAENKIQKSYNEIISQSLQEKALEQKKHFSFKLYLMLANMLPFLILCQCLFRAFSSWMTGVWLPSDFFIHATILIAGATIPGYYLMALLLERKTAQLIAENKIGINNSGKLHEVEQDLQDILNKISDLAILAENNLKEVASKNNSQKLGISANFDK